MDGPNTSRLNVVLAVLHLQALGLALAVARTCKSSRTRRRRRSTVYQRRQGTHHEVLHRLIGRGLPEDSTQFFAAFRMTSDTFEHLHSLLASHLEGLRHLKGAEFLSTKEKLAATLRYLASGDMENSIAHSCHLSREAMSRLIQQTCRIIWEVLKPIYLEPPDKKEWLRIERDFESKCHFPHCIGAIDGKFIRNQSLPSMMSAGKNNNSLVLLAACDAHYQFIVVDVGHYCMTADSGTFRATRFGQQLLKEALNIPTPTRLLDQNQGNTLPYVFAADDTFPLLYNVMRPYGSRGHATRTEDLIFNYRISIAKQMIENAFGIMASHWRLMYNIINMNAEHTSNVIMATCVLHNYMLRSEEKIPLEQRLYCPEGYDDREDSDGNVIPGKWRVSIPQNACIIGSRGAMGSNNHTRSSGSLRDAFRDYFLSPKGEVPWQMHIITEQQQK